MTAGELLRELHRRGVRLTAHEGRLRCEAPRGTITPDLVEAMRQHKAAVLAILQGAEVEAGPEWRPRLGESFPAVWPSGECVRCGGRRWRWSTAAGRWECADPECEAKGQALWRRG